MSLKKRGFHMILLEVMALAIIGPPAMAIMLEGAAIMAGHSTALTVIAMVWTFIRNWGCDVVFGQIVSAGIFPCICCLTVGRHPRFCPAMSFQIRS